MAEIFFMDSLQKIFSQQRPQQGEIKILTGLKGETVSFQLVCHVQKGECVKIHLPRQGENSVPDNMELEFFRVMEVPTGRSCYDEDNRDDNYLFYDSRMCPDVLVPFEENVWEPEEECWQTLWVRVGLKDESVREDAEGQALSFHIEMCEKQAEESGHMFSWDKNIFVRVIDAQLPEQKLIHTEWFHCDCLADYYQVPVFSEEHWEAIESFIRLAADRGVNMILIPVFTPPLDTAVGGERTTVQLTDIVEEDRNGKSIYHFSFEKLHRFIGICKNAGIRYLEIAHLFTQWGAEHAPKIVVEKNGEKIRRFGWDTDAAGEDYRNFLAQFLPALKEELKKEDMLSNTWFHISDEPSENQVESYKKAAEGVKDLLADCHVTDALSSFRFYEEGLVKHPVVASNHIEPFLEAKVPGLWTYYCCSQAKDVSNRFMSMPLARTRILGVQLYLGKLAGFLHWGYNFYNTQYSLEHINPFQVTDAGGGFPSGDSFVAYPGEGRKAWPSIRLEALAQAMYDLRALCLLEEKKGREKVCGIIEEELGNVTFSSYPKDSETLLKFRDRINELLEELG